MSLERKYFNCKNHLVAPSCDPWIVKNTSTQYDESEYELNKDEIMANKICAKCKHFAPNDQVAS